MQTRNTQAGLGQKGPWVVWSLEKSQLPKDVYTKKVVYFSNATDSSTLMERDAIIRSNFIHKPPLLPHPGAGPHSASDLALLLDGCCSPSLFFFFFFFSFQPMYPIELSFQSCSLGGTCYSIAWNKGLRVLANFLFARLKLNTSIRNFFIFKKIKIYKSKSKSN